MPGRRGGARAGLLEIEAHHNRRKHQDPRDQGCGDPGSRLVRARKLFRKRIFKNYTFFFRIIILPYKCYGCIIIIIIIIVVYI